jgi:hypothetical protein
MGLRNYMKKSDESPHITKNSELELPDWSGMADSAGRISAAAAIELPEQYVQLFPEAYRRRQRQPADKCTVEFVL